MGHPVYMRNKQRALVLSDHYLPCGIELLQHVGNDQFLQILNRSFLALICLKSGRRSEALTIAEEAFQDALAQGGVLAPICELLLSSILMETGDQLKAKERLEESVALLGKLAFEAPLKKSNVSVLGTIASIKRGDFGLKPEAVHRERIDQCLFRIRMFGPIRVFHQDEEIDAACWRTVKSRHLLAYLAHRDQPVSTDQIMEDLWPDLDPQRASALFHTTLYYLRRLLQQFSDEELIIRGSKRYQLRPGMILSDRFEFKAKATFALGKPMTKALAEELEATIQLYTGDYLLDLDYQWVIPVQEELKNLYIELKQKLAIYYLQNEMYTRSVLHLKQIMDLKPYSEEILQLLLTNYAAMGDQLAVKKQYTAFTATIAEELGMQPSFELVRFYKEISMV